MPLVLLLLQTLLPSAVADLLREPEYVVTRESDGWAVRKPATGKWHAVTISRHAERGPAEFRRRSLPRLRLPALFVHFDPATSGRTVIADWTRQEDAREIEEDVRDILKRFAAGGTLALLESTTVYMARLFGASGHTAENDADFERFVVYLDPFRATGRLHAAATLVHELTHLRRYQARGFHGNRAAAVLSRNDFVLLGLADELEACQAEANLVRAFLDSQTTDQVRDAVRDAFRDPELRWPPALTLLAGLERPADEKVRLRDARRHVVLDLAGNAGRYWDAHHADVVLPVLRERMRGWHDSAHEWKHIRAEQPEWVQAQTLVRGSGH